MGRPNRFFTLSRSGLIVQAQNRVVLPAGKNAETDKENQHHQMAATYEGAGWIIGHDPATSAAWNAATLLALTETLYSVDRQVGVVIHFYGGQREKAGLREMQGILANLHSNGQTTDPMTTRSGGIVDVNLDRTNYNLQITEDVIAAYQHFLEAVESGATSSPELLQSAWHRH